jgi:ferredoxin
MPKIIHYRNKCIGCSICFEMQPAFWRMSKKDGKATLVQSIVKKDIHQLAINEADKDLSVEVEKACPVKVIKVV